MSDASAGEDTEFKAALDPWLVVPDFRPVGMLDFLLFGFAKHHHRLGGLSWIRSSPIIQLDEASGRAETASGSRYTLGRKLAGPEALDSEGLLAWRSLVLQETTPEEDNQLRAFKVARRLGLAPPDKDPASIVAFLEAHRASYIRARTIGQGNV